MFREMRRINKKMTENETIALLVRGREGILGTLSENGYPYTTVVNYVYYNGKIYFHSAKEGHKIDNIRNHDKVSFTVYDNVKVIGEELNTLYESATLFGRAKVIPATKEILMALVYKYSDLEQDKADAFIERDISDTAIVEIEIEHLTGKIGK